MSRHEAGLLRVAAVYRLHLVLDGRALCGLAVDYADLSEDQSGLLAWNDGPVERCGRGAEALLAGAGWAPRPAAETHETVRYEDLRAGELVEVRVRDGAIGWEWETREVLATDGGLVRWRDGDREYEINPAADRGGLIRRPARTARTGGIR